MRFTNGGLKEISRFGIEWTGKNIKEIGNCRLRPAESITESLILAQNERWRRVLSMQVERQGSFGSPRAADG